MSQGPENNQLAKPELSATGERFVPQSAADHIQVAYEHLHRYLFAQEFCRGLDVLDIASGEGYGSALLAQSARSVVGVDISEEAVGHCKRKYQRENLEFHKGDCSKIPLSKHSVDVVVSFETIEHIHAHDRFLQEVIRVLRPKGILIISSPDKHEYSDRNGYSNPFHVSELYRQDFLKLLKRHFAHSRSFQQRLVAGSYIAADRHEGSPVVYGTYRGNTQGGTFNEGVHEGLYAVAICSNEPIPEIQAGLFENRFESARIWDWYEQSSRVHHELAQLKDTLAKQSDTLLRAEQARAELEKRLGEIQHHHDELRSGFESQSEEDRTTEQSLRARIIELDREVVARGEWGKSLDLKIAGLLEQLSQTNAQLENETARAKQLSNERELSVREQECLLAELKLRQIQLQEREAGLAQLGETRARQDEQIRELIQEIEQLRRNLVGQEAIQTSLKDEVRSQQEIVEDLVSSKEKVRHDLQLSLREVQAAFNGKQAELEAMVCQLNELVHKNQELDKEVFNRGEWGLRLDKEIADLRAQLGTCESQLSKSREEAASLADRLAKSEEALLAQVSHEQQMSELKASEFSALETELKCCEAKLGKTVQEMAAISCQLGQSEKKAVALQAELERCLAQLETASFKSTECARRLADAEQTICSLHAAGERLAGELSQSKVECEARRARLEEELARTRASHAGELALLSGERESLQRKLAETEAQSAAELGNHKLAREQLEVALEDLRSQVTLVQASLEKSREVCFVKEQELSDSASRISSLEAKLRRLEQDHAAAEEQLLAAQQQTQEILQSSEDRLRWGASLDSELIALRQRLNEREDSLAQQEIRGRELEENLAKREAEAVRLAELCERQTGKITRMQAAFSWKLTAPLRLFRRTFID